MLEYSIKELHNITYTHFTCSSYTLIRSMSTYTVHCFPSSTATIILYTSSQFISYSLISPPPYQVYCVAKMFSLFIVLFSAICVLLRPSMDRASQSHCLGCSEYGLYSKSLSSVDIYHSTFDTLLHELQYPMSSTFVVYLHQCLLGCHHSCQ